MKHIPRVACGLVVVVAGCSFIPVDPGAEKVRLETAERVAACEKLGSTNSVVLHEIIGIDRSGQAIASDLFRISANTAVQLGGNALVPIGKPVAGRQKFDIYRCN